ncbi:MAG TPA: FAD-binding protein [Actinopolymorphaceae bacterium]
MTSLSRRGLLGGAAGAVVASTAAGAAAASPSTSWMPRSNFGPVVVRPNDGRYPDLVRGTNQRFVGRPQYVVLAGSTEQVVRAVQQAVDEGKRVQVRSGGHCYENFVYNDEVQVVVDLSLLSRVYWDHNFKGHVVEAGAELYNVYETLYKGWGVAIPGGSCGSVGAGGHISGGGYGLLSRLHGLTVDHLYGVEVVVVDKSGKAKVVVATREKHDKNRDLWWAYTGGGGGTFGIVTKYIFRDLPKPPSTVILQASAWNWDALGEQGFTRLLRNWGDWLEENSAPDSPYAGLFGILKLNKRTSSSSQIGLLTQMDATRSDTDELYDRYLAALNAGLPVEAEMVTQTQQMGEHPPMPRFASPTAMPWFLATWELSGGNPNLDFKNKSAYHRNRYTDDQVAALYHNLTRTDYTNPSMLAQIDSYGCRINTVAPNATAVPQRDSIMKTQFQVYWAPGTPGDEHLQFIRETYRDTFEDTGGVPVPNDVTDGCYVNYPDVDLNNSTWNTSGVRWSTLYWKDNYPRLRRAKRAYDPRNVFRHTQSVEL